jgi:hypothetical protein
VSSGGFDSQVQFVFGRVQVFFGFRAVALHIVMIGGTGSFHFVDRFHYVFVNRIKIAPIVNLRRKKSATSKGQTDNRTDSKELLHGSFLQRGIAKLGLAYRRAESIDRFGRSGCDDSINLYEGSGADKRGFSAVSAPRIPADQDSRFRPLKAAAL